MEITWILDPMRFKWKVSDTPIAMAVEQIVNTRPPAVLDPALGFRLSQIEDSFCFPALLLLNDAIDFIPVGTFKVLSKQLHLSRFDYGKKMLDAERKICKGVMEMGGLSLFPHRHSSALWADCISEWMRLEYRIAFEGQPTTKRILSEKWSRDASQLHQYQNPNDPTDSSFVLNYNLVQAAIDIAKPDPTLPARRRKLKADFHTEYWTPWLKAQRAYKKDFLPHIAIMRREHGKVFGQRKGHQKQQIFPEPIKNLSNRGPKKRI
jgi:hypothetical protein